MENRLLTIMFIDVQGFTKRTANATREETSKFIEETRGFVTSHLEKLQGRLVKTMGDGFLAAFDSPTNAVQCGNEIQRKMLARNANILNPDHFVRFRIGINTGEVGIDEGGDLFGDPVNIAARIESFAESGAVYISESTFLAMNRNEFGAVDLGPQMFKNATREIRVYKILSEEDQKTVSKTGSAPSDGKKPSPLNLFRLQALVLVLFLLSTTFYATSRIWKAFSTRSPNSQRNQQTSEAGDQTTKTQRPPSVQASFEDIQKSFKDGKFDEASKKIIALKDSEPTLNYQFKPKELAKMSWVLFQAGGREKSQKFMELAIERAKGNPRLVNALEGRLKRIKMGLDFLPPGADGQGKRPQGRKLRDDQPEDDNQD